MYLQELCHDPNLRVSTTKVVKPDQLVLVLYLTNQKQSKLSGVTLSVEPPSNTKVFETIQRTHLFNNNTYQLE